MSLSPGAADFFPASESAALLLPRPADSAAPRPPRGRSPPLLPPPTGATTDPSEYDDGGVKVGTGGKLDEDEDKDEDDDDDDDDDEDEDEDASGAEDDEDSAGPATLAQLGPLEDLPGTRPSSSTTIKGL